MIQPLMKTTILENSDYSHQSHRVSKQDVGIWEFREGAMGELAFNRVKHFIVWDNKCPEDGQEQQ